MVERGFRYKALWIMLSSATEQPDMSTAGLSCKFFVRCREHNGPKGTRTSAWASGHPDFCDIMEYRPRYLKTRRPR